MTTHSLDLLCKSRG